MPIVEIEIILKPNEAIDPEISSHLANELGKIFDSQKGGTWVKIHVLPESHYAENDMKAGSVHPIFVSVLKSALPSQVMLEIEIAKITDVVARITGRPTENVHVIYTPEGSGRVAFGGNLIP